MLDWFRAFHQVLFRLGLAATLGHSSKSDVGIVKSNKNQHVALPKMDGVDDRVDNNPAERWWADIEPEVSMKRVELA